MSYEQQLVILVEISIWFAFISSKHWVPKIQDIPINISRLMFLKSFPNSIFYINEIQLDECERGSYFLTLKKLFVKSKLRQCNHRDDLLVIANQKTQLF